MPTVAGKILKSGMKDGRFACLIALNREAPKAGESVKVKWGSTRTLPQNSLYWLFLHWLINEAGLKEQGHFSPDALHLDLKAHFLSEKVFSKGQFEAIEEGTTTTLTKSEFGDYFDKVNEFVKDFFDIDTAPFWDDYQESSGRI